VNGALPPDLAELERAGIYLISPQDTDSRVIGGRVVERIAISEERTMVVARVVLRGPRPRGGGRFETARAVLCLTGGDHPVAFAVRARWLGDVVRALATVHVENQAVRRESVRSGLRAVELPAELLDVADEAGLDAQAIVIAAARALPELPTAAREQLIADARYGAGPT
jgi:hypothetical protein